MSEKFKMPEKWYVRGSREMRIFNDKILDNKANLAFGGKYYTTKDYSFKLWNYHEVIPFGYTEITFEQFNEYYCSVQSENASSIEQLREKCKRLELMPFFSGNEFMTLELKNYDSRTMHRLEKYRDFDKLCENALIILNLEK